VAQLAAQTPSSSNNSPAGDAPLACPAAAPPTDRAGNLRRSSRRSAEHRRS